MNKDIYNLHDLIDQYGSPDALVDNYSSESGYAIWGFEEFYSLSQKEIYNNIESGADPFSTVQKLLNIWSEDNSDVKVLGLLSYDIKNIIYSHIQFKALNTNFPYMWFGKPKKIRRYFIEENNNKPDTKLLSTISDIKNLSEYKNIIKKIKRELKAGNTYQINLTMEKIFKIHANPIDIYLAIREYAQPQYGYYLNIGSHQILSFSPEEFFHTEGKKIYTYPMKGTIERDKDKDIDETLKKTLKNSTKDKAEHIMIVDLLRNDLGKICKYGSVNVKNLFSINSYPTVHQMVSCIYGVLKENIQYIDIFKALCPGGSITGAPKESSMRIIDSLENYNRDIYTGAIGHINHNGDMYFNMAIRTMMIKQNIAKYCVGGGIVWDSCANKEWHEAQLKGKILDQFIKE